MTVKTESAFITGVKDITAGTVARIALCVTGHPLDTIKVKLQTQPTGSNQLYSGTLDCATKIVKNEGIGGLFRGVQSPLLGQAAMNSTLFFANGQAKKLVEKKPGEPLSYGDLFISGCITGFAVAFVEGPVDLVKSQLQVNFKEYNGFLDCARKVAGTYGIRGIYQGLGATLIRNIPANAAYFGVYEATKRLSLAKNESINKVPGYKLFIAGGMGGIAYWIAIYPIDVIKTVLQTDSLNKATRKYKGVLDVAQHIHRTQGMNGFFRGFAPCMIRAFPANASCFYFYEQTR